MNLLKGAPNIVQLEEIILDSDEASLVQELCQRGDLWDFLEEILCYKIPENEALKMLY